MKKLLLTLLMVGGIAVANPPAQGSDAELRKGPWAFEPDSTLPNVLILGDSISIGYTLGVRQGLEGKANVFRPVKVVGKRYRPENCAGTTLGVKEIDRWLAEREEWDVIHFNWGLHDLKHVHPESKKNSTSFDDPQQASPEAYENNLAELVQKLKATGATLIFATTTPYPDVVRPARLPADAKRYNDIALQIMGKHDIQVNDLYAVVEGRLEELQKPKNVHFNRRGNEVLSDHVTTVIQAALVAKRSKK